MSINTLSANNAYLNQLKLRNDITDAAYQEENAKTSFYDLLKDGVQDVIDTQRNAEELSMEAITGKVDLSELVTAVSDAELSLNTVVAIRDKVISAYQDIIRMPI
ncbi:MAG: flagellar hook-basal body complex protein FliE [Rickettsiales bacterium]